jgi:hypothetical protein
MNAAVSYHVSHQPLTGGAPRPEHRPSRPIRRSERPRTARGRHGLSALAAALASWR